MILFILALSFFAWGSGDHHHAEKITLTPEAVRNFQITCEDFKGSVPSTSIVKSGTNVNVYECLGKNTFISNEPDHLHAGDRIVVSGASFLKTVELSQEEGPAEGHGH